MNAAVVLDGLILGELRDFRTPTGEVLAVEVTVPSARSVTAGC